MQVLGEPRADVGAESGIGGETSAGHEPTIAEVTAEALRRNDRYLLEFIEGFGICPFARGCRESGRLYREVLLTSTPDVSTVTRKILDLGKQLSQDIEIALLLFPRLVIEPLEFERLIRDVQQQEKKLRSGPPDFFIVAFHPELPGTFRNAHTAVRFMRRSPDPTIQLVRPGAIERARAGAREPERLSDFVAEAGLRAVQSRGVDVVTAMLRSFRQ